MTSFKNPFNKELFAFPLDSFKEHYLKDENSHIVFSGKFGIGKTFFLTHFFLDETQAGLLPQERQANVITLRPVNYSIASNEDIYRYLKYDIILSMLSKKIELQENDFAFGDTLPRFLKKHAEDIFRNVVLMIPKVGKSIVEVHDSLKQLILKMHEFNKEARASEGEIFVDFLEGVYNDEKSLYDNDVIITLIRNVLSRVKDHSKKENVLIIDDLDRIDPEHIFRLLNVFAARLDLGGYGTSGFNFDKIIMVCDVRNIKNIFHAKYGINTDFNGYIDKFYSDEVFHFDNRLIVQKVAETAFSSFKFKGALSGDHEKSYRASLLNYKNLAIDLLTMFVKSGQISLRMLYNRIRFNVYIDLNKRIHIGNRVSLERTSQPVIMQFMVLEKITGGLGNIKEFMDHLSPYDFDFSLDDMIVYAKEMIFLLTATEHGFRATKGYATFQIGGIKLRYEIVDVRGDMKIYIAEVAETTISDSTIYPFSKSEFRILLAEFISWLKDI